METSGEEWHKWRGQGLGSSDAPVIMGASPWSTPYQLWEEKIGLTKREVSNFATQRGHELEPVARAQYELETGLDMPATLAVHETRPWLRASLDGFNAENNIVLEIKCPGKDDHETAVNGKVPDKYYPQLQHQLLVTGATCVHYYSFDGKRGVLVEVKPDLPYIQRLLNTELAFWDNVLTKIPPPLSDADIKKCDNFEMLGLADTLVMITEQVKKLEAEAEAIKEKLKAAMDHPIVQFGRVKGQRIYRAGSIDYKSVKELADVDLEQYRKSGTEYFTFKIEKKQC